MMKIRMTFNDDNVDNFLCKNDVFIDNDDDEHCNGDYKHNDDNDSQEKSGDNDNWHYCNDNDEHGEH